MANSFHLQLSGAHRDVDPAPRSRPFAIPATKLGLALAFAVLLLPALASAQFNHPGALVGAEQLAFAKGKVAAQQEPWTGAFDFMKALPQGSLSYVPLGYVNVYQGSFGEGDSGGWRMMIDAKAAYLHALAWAISDNPAHAQKSIECLNAWTYKLETITGVNAKLIGAAAFASFANAAELLKHTDAGWDPVDQAQCATMFNTVAYPLIQDFQPNYNGNWDAIITHAMMAMGVFLDDQAMFDRAVNYFKSGVGNGSLPNYVQADGTTQETYRDAEHENMGIAGLAGSCQTAGNQDIDLWGYLDNRLLAGAEGVAERVMSAGIRPIPCWESIYNHYHNGLGHPMPNTERVFNGWFEYRPEDFGLMTANGFGTLTSYMTTSVPTPSTSFGGLKSTFRQ